MFIVKIPGINGLEKTRGCEKAGNAILESLRKIHSNENGIPIDVDLLDLEDIHLDNNRLEEANKLIYENSFETFEAKPRTVFLGGDHSISYSIGKAFLDYCKQNEKKPCLIVFDSHPDCMPAEKEPNHEQWLRKLIEEGFPTENILLVGLRNSLKEEIRFLKEKKIQTININLFLEDIENACDTIMEFANGKELYVSIDIDVVDPSCAPGTGYPVAGGLTSRQLIYLMQKINKIRSLRAVDIVEVNSEKDFNEMTVQLAAKILGELV